MARQGALRNFIGPEPCLPIERNWFKRNLDAWASNSHVRFWTNIEGCRDSKLYFSEPDKSKTKFLLNLSKSHLSALIRIITGHCRFKLHMSRMGLSQETLCPLCESDFDTPYHFLCLCPYNAIRRHELFGNFVLSANEYSRLDLRRILGFFTESNRVL